MNQDRTNRKLAAIFSTDVVGYSRMMEADESWTIQNLEENKRLMSSIIEDYKGRVVDSPGDNLLAEFSSVINAVECAVKIQKQLSKKNSRLTEEHQMKFRIGVNLGDLVEEDGKLYGNGVNIAARLEALALPGGICISNKVYDEIKTKLVLGYEYIGEHTVKNISDPIRVYSVLIEPEAFVSVIGEEKPTRSPSSKRVTSTIIVILIIFAGLLVWKFYPNKRIKTDSTSIVSEQVAVPEVKEAPKSIAVLPFEDISPEKDQEYFVDGLSEEILNSLTQIPHLGVTARTSSFTFKGTNKTVQEIAGILGVDHILEGSVRKVGKALRITAQLIRASDGLNLWSVTYDRELKDIFKIQEDIASNVAAKLKLTLEAFQLLGGTENIEAYELYLKAKGRREKAYDERSLELLDSAIMLDPDFALAYALKAEIHNLAILFGSPDRTIEELDKCKRAIDKALALEPDLAYGYMVLGNIKSFEGEWIKAEYNFHKALELSDDSLSGDYYAIIPFNISVGKFKKAYELSEKIRKNDPLNQTIPVLQCLIYGMLGNRQRAEELYQNKNKAMLSASSADEAITIVRIGSGAPLSSEEIVSARRIHISVKTYIDSPKKGLMALRRIYNTEDDLSSYDLINIYLWAAYFGDAEFALEAMEKSAGISSSILHCWSPVMKEVRQYPRFKEFVREIGLVDYWKTYGWPDLCHPVGDDDFECD